MLNLNDREWKAFFICDIFSLESTSSGIDGNKLSKEQGNIPYLTRTDLNNGYKSFVGQQAEKYKIDSGNCITIGLDTQTAFYQPHSFYTGQNIQVLKNEKLNKYNAKFFIPLLHNAMVSLNWGGNGATLGRLKKKKIVVPITDDGQPDYAFMEQYVREIENKLKKDYIDFINAELYIPPIPLVEKKWKEFFISDICYISSGRDIYDSEREEGEVPYITSTASNNGIKYYVSNTNETLEENAISVNRNGSVGYSFYHKYKALYSNDCRKLKLKQCRNEFVALFITNQITQQKDKYNYGYKMGTGRLKKQMIMLPITNDGSPDYNYMEQYIKAIMFGKYKKYLEYQNCLTP